MILKHVMVEVKLEPSASSFNYMPGECRNLNARSVVFFDF